MHGIPAALTVNQAEKQLVYLYVHADPEGNKVTITTGNWQKAGIELSISRHAAAELHDRLTVALDALNTAQGAPRAWWRRLLRIGG